ncbi:hypothetical protein BC827DRAFT_1200298 [Russula dissimulans]|nr:hypothetical protein BC827DRAFT_1200298 [Russula dissimulans]
MFSLLCAILILSAPLMASAVAPILALAALLAPFQPQDSRLHARQIFVPAECLTICDPFIEAINNCFTESCTCTTQIMGALSDCVECSVQSGQTSPDDGQAALDNFAENCAADGFPLSATSVTVSPEATLPSVNGPTPTALPTGFPLSSSNPSNSSSAQAGTTTTTPSEATATSQRGPQSPTTGSGGASGGRRVVGRADSEGMCTLLVLLMVVLVA